MITKKILGLVLPLTIFVIAAAGVYLATTRWRASQSPNRPPNKSDNKLTNIEGLNEGDLVDLPTLSTSTGEPVSLNQLKEKRILCVFFSPACSGCAKDVDLWKDLKEESTKRNTAFFIVDVGSDHEALKKFIVAYQLQNLPILFDPNHKVGPALKINFVPAYLLFVNDGRVLHRWDGIRNYEPQKDRARVAEFFQFGAD
jgi:peroxiredoxin